MDYHPAVLKDVMILFFSCSAVLLVTVRGSAQPQTRGLRGHFETDMLGSEMVETVPFPEPAIR